MIFLFDPYIFVDFLVNFNILFLLFSMRNYRPKEIYFLRLEDGECTLQMSTTFLQNLELDLALRKTAMK